MRRPAVRFRSAPPAFARESQGKAAAPEPNGRRRACFRELRLGKPSKPKKRYFRQLAAHGANIMTYVYILRSVSGDHYYVGMTEDLRNRLSRHNSGDVPHTAKFRPWVVKTYVAFSDTERAVNFERYLKTPSGRPFAKKHL